MISASELQLLWTKLIISNPQLELLYRMHILFCLIVIDYIKKTHTFWVIFACSSFMKIIDYNYFKKGFNALLTTECWIKCYGPLQNE